MSELTEENCITAICIFEALTEGEGQGCGMVTTGYFGYGNSA